MRKPIYEVFRDAQMRKPAASHKEKLDWFIAKIQSDPLYLDDLAKEYFDRNARIWGAREIEPDSFTLARTPQAVQRIERAQETREANAARPVPPRVAPQEEIERRRKARSESAARTDQAFETLKAKIREVILLDLVLPNGKALRHATGAECAKAGGFYAEIAKHIKPTQVVDRHLTEPDLQNIRARYFQRNSGRAA